MTYQRILELTSAPPGVLAENQTPPFDEIEIQSRWFAGHFPRTYQSNHGQEITIISPGEWNRGAGPDFINATITVDQQTLYGPIEIDLEARNWELHGHRENPHFDDVILHVVLNDNGPTFFTRTSSNREVPRIILSPTEVNTALGRPRLAQALARPGLCLTPLSEMAESDLNSLLREAARHRLQLKAARFQQTTALHHFSQALWEALADALGYAANRLPMRLLAQRLPIQKLLQHSPADRVAILFGTAGFLSPTLHETSPAESREWLEELWTRWWKHRPDYEFPPDRTPAWSARNTRPGNHPQRRLAALAAAATSWPSLAALARQKPPFAKFSKSLTALRDPFWDHHHTLSSKRRPQPLRLLGPARVHEFLVNSLYPLHPDDWESYSIIKAPTPNQKVKRCCERLFGSLARARPHLKFAWQHQALLQLYQDFCLEDVSNCQACLFPEQLAQWKPSTRS